MTLIIKLGHLKKGKPLLDKDVYGFRFNIARRVIRAVKKAHQKLYYDDWWNGRESGNPNFELAPSEPLRIDMYDLNRVDVMLLTQMRYWDLNHNTSHSLAMFTANCHICSA